MKVNFHTHTRRCRHASGSEEEFVAAAIDSGVGVLGFSDHAPFPDGSFGPRMPFDELSEHFLTVERLKRDNAGVIEIRRGLEIEYLPIYRGYYDVLIEKWRVDYLLLGAHFFRRPDGSVISVTGEMASGDVLLYARAVEEALATGCFSALAHPDLFGMARLAWGKEHDEATEIILNAALKYGAVIEYNANGLRRGARDFPDGTRCMYPVERFWQRAAESGVPVIVGSGCHSVDAVWDEYVDRAYNDLAALGITPVEDIGRK